MPTKNYIETVKALQLFIETNKLSITVDSIKDLIYNSNPDPMIWNREYLFYWMWLCDSNNIEYSQNVIDLSTNCWNNFPHKALWWKSPAEVYWNI